MVKNKCINLFCFEGEGSLVKNIHIDLLHINMWHYKGGEVGECSERIQSKLLHFKGGERPLVKEFPMEKGIGVKLYKGL